MSEHLRKHITASKMDVFPQAREVVPHAPSSLGNFLSRAPPEIKVLSVGSRIVDQAPGLFAVRLDGWSVRLLDSVLESKYRQRATFEKKFGIRLVQPTGNELCLPLLSAKVLNDSTELSRDGKYSKRS
jgi:hypothetical protein